MPFREPRFGAKGYGRMLPNMALEQERRGGVPGYARYSFLRQCLHCEPRWYRVDHSPPLFTKGGGFVFSGGFEYVQQL